MPWVTRADIQRGQLELTGAATRGTSFSPQMSGTWGGFYSQAPA